MDLAPLTSLAAGQHGCFANRQLASVGISDDQLHRLRKQGLVLPAQHRGVHRFASHTETWRQRVMAATLSMPDAMASHRTAAVLWDLEGFQPGRIELTVQHGDWRDRDIVVHQTKDLVGGDYDERYGIPCTSLIRTLVDLPAVAWEDAVRTGARPRMPQRPLGAEARAHAPPRGRPPGSERHGDAPGAARTARRG